VVGRKSHTYILAPRRSVQRLPSPPPGHCSRTRASAPSAIRPTATDGATMTIPFGCPAVGPASASETNRCSKSPRNRHQRAIVSAHQDERRSTGRGWPGSWAPSVRGRRERSQAPTRAGVRRRFGPHQLRHAHARSRATIACAFAPSASDGPPPPRARAYATAPTEPANESAAEATLQKRRSCSLPRPERPDGSRAA